MEKEFHRQPIFDKDRECFAHLVELPNVSVFGPTPAEALEKLKTARELMKECSQMEVNPFRNPLHGMYTRDRSTFPLMHNFITLWQTKQRRQE